LLPADIYRPLCPAKRFPCPQPFGLRDAYYARFNDERGLNALQQYTTVSPRDNVIGLNIGAIGLHLKGENFRVNTVFHAGDIPAAIWSTDFPVVQAANAGIKLADGLWLDGGFFATHLGTESFLPKENLLSSTAVATYNEPFYQAGFRLGYETKSDWRFELWALNGYNRFLDNNSDKALGVLIAKDFPRIPPFPTVIFLGTNRNSKVRFLSSRVPKCVFQYCFKPLAPHPWR
jgi:hypothetical protein